MKGNEDLKAKIAKIQQKGKAQVQAPPVQEEMAEVQPAEEELSMEELNAEFEAKKKALMQKAKQKEQPAEEEGAGLDEAIAEYADDAKFRVEMVFQLVQLNKSMKEIADALKSLVNNGDE